VLRVVAAVVGAFAGVLAILLVAVGQLGKVDRQTLVVCLVVAAAAAAVAGWRRRRA
jgi:ABC-type phosphate/phosphonate transport system permease subunit